MSKRFSFSNDTLEQMILDSGDPRFTRNVPASIVRELFPFQDDNGYLVKFAKESDSGRGIPFVDLYHPELSITGCPDLMTDRVWSFKISRQKKNPSNAQLTTGTERHIEGVLKGIANSNMLVPLVLLNYDGVSWWKCEFDDCGEIFRTIEPIRNSKRRGNNNPVTITNKKVSASSKTYMYKTLTFNISSCVNKGLTSGWEIIRGKPSLPTEVRY